MDVHRICWYTTAKRIDYYYCAFKKWYTINNITDGSSFEERTKVNQNTPEFYSVSLKMVTIFHSHTTYKSDSSL